MKANSIHCIRVTYRVLRLLYYSDWVYLEELRITCMDWSALVKWATGVFVVRRVAGHHNTITATMGSVEATVLIWCKIKYENVKIKIMSGPWFRAVDRGWVYSKFNVCTAVVTDAMHMIWRIFCPKDEIFTNISIRYQYFFMYDLRHGTRSALSCCDWCRPPSLLALCKQHQSKIQVHEEMRNTVSLQNFLSKRVLCCHKWQSCSLWVFVHEMGTAESIGGFWKWMEATSHGMVLLRTWVNWNQHKKKQIQELFCTAFTACRTYKPLWFQ